jgi:hypothetical protein
VAIPRLEDRLARRRLDGATLEVGIDGLSNYQIRLRFESGHGALRYARLRFTRIHCRDRLDDSSQYLALL